MRTNKDVHQNSKQVRKLSNFDFLQDANQTNLDPIQRAILVYYPSHQELDFMPEIRWLYRSWIEMMKDELPNWRTDFIIYTEIYSSPLQQLGCVLNQKRAHLTELPKCRVFLYLRLSNRLIDKSTDRQKVLINSNLKSFYKINLNRSIELNKYIIQYEYIDSINIIAESYPTFQMYDFILRTDTDVFITKQFAKYIPKIRDSILVGQGGYSTPFNTHRLSRIATDMNWHNKNLTNIGSTWYGAANLAHRIANLTLDAILHLSKYEFTLAERESKLEDLLWPDWHYGVLVLYGTHLAINHLIMADSMTVVEANKILDQSATDTKENGIRKNKRLHLHCWHGDEDFSKFKFKTGLYNSKFVRTFINKTSAQGYAMRMAWESQQMTLHKLQNKLNQINNEKIV